METLHQKRAQAIAAINKVANQEHAPAGRFKEGDQVWLEAINLKLPYHTPKLAPRRHGPFCISKVISPVAYKLALPLSWGIHDVFHSSLLLPYKETTTHGPNFTRPPPDLIEGEEEYEVEAIINHRRHGRRRQLQYLIKWKGYPSSDNTWEAMDDVHADDLTREYHRRHPLELLKNKTNRGTKKLACTLQFLTTTPSPTQKVASWLLHSTTPPITSFPDHSLTPKSSKGRLSAFITHLEPTSIAPNENTLSNTLASATTSTAGTTPPLKTWLNRPVKHPIPLTSWPRVTPLPTGPIPLTKTASVTLTSSQSLKMLGTAMKNSTRPPFLPFQGKPTSSRELLTSSTLPLYCINQHGHLYMRDPSPPLSSPLSAPPSPTSITWSTRGWPTTLQNLLASGRRRAINAWPNKSVGSRDSRTTSANSTPTSKASSVPFKMYWLASTSTALPHPAQPPHHAPSSSHSALTDRQPRRPRLPRPERFHNPMLERSPCSGRGGPL